jgi:hypothetical protein
MPSAIIALITTLLPAVLKLVMYIIEKKADNQKLKEDFLKFIASLDSDVTVKLNSKYHEQIERLKKQIEEGK